VIPEPVELDPYPLELLAQRRDRLGLFGQLTLLVTQPALPILERLDLSLDLLVVHGAMVRDGASPGEASGNPGAMSNGKTDDAKGRVKEAAGSITGDDKLKNEGKVDRAAGSVKDKVGDAADKAKDVVNPKD